MSLRSEFIRLFNEVIANSKKITELPSATTPLSGNELIEIVQNGENKKVSSTYLGGSSGIVVSIVAGTNITVDNTDPANPIVSSSGGGGWAVTGLTTLTGDVEINGSAVNSVLFNSIYDFTISALNDINVTPTGDFKVNGTSIFSGIITANDDVTFLTTKGIDSLGVLNVGATNATTVNVGTGSGNTNINIGTSGTNTIQIGNSASTVNILGSVIYENVTNLQVSDKLITLNKGGAAASATGSGIELEENALITAYIKTTGGRDGWLLKAPSISNDVSFLFTNISAARSYTLPDSSGTMLLTAMVSGGATMTTAGVVTLTNASVTGQAITGYVSGAGTVSPTDSILQAIQKLDGNDNTKWSLASGGTLTGANTIIGTTTNILKCVFNSLGTTQTNGAGLWLANTTAATSGNQQISPSLVLEGQGFETIGSTSQSVKYIIDVLPAQATNSGGTLRIKYNNNSGTTFDALSITQNSSVPSSWIFNGGIFDFKNGSNTTVVRNSAGALQLNGGSGSGTSNLIFANTSSNNTNNSIAFAFSNSIYNNTGAVITRTNTGIQVDYTMTASGSGVGSTTTHSVFNLTPTFSMSGSTLNLTGVIYNPSITATLGTHFGFVSVPTTAINVFGASTGANALVVIGAGTTSLAPFKLTSGTNLTTAVAGCMEYDGTNLFFTRSGTTRESVICSNAVNTVSPTSPNRTITVIIAGTTYYLHAKTTND